MFNYKGSSIKEAGVSVPTEIMGFSSLPEAGEKFIVADEKVIKQVAELRAAADKEKQFAERGKLSLSDLFGKIQDGELKELNIVLKADAQGFLNIQKSSTQNQIQGLGKLYLEHGRVDLYGHKFIVNKANANFVGSLDAPQLEAEVVVDPSTVENNVVAGVQVYGTAKKPQITLFSKPTMSQNEIVSYLLYGHGLEKNVQNNNSDNSSSQLLMTLGLGTTTGLLNSIVGKFHNTHSSKDFKDFHKDIVSGLLKESAFKSGLDVFYKDLFDVLGFYNHFTGDLTFNNK